MPVGLQSAEFSNEAADTANEVSTPIWIEQIAEQINRAAANGAFETWIEDVKVLACQSDLEDAGYVVDTGTLRRGQYRVNWEPVIEPPE